MNGIVLMHVRVHWSWGGRWPQNESQIGLKMKVKSAPKNKNKKRINK
jgi:hypothetical protein